MPNLVEALKTKLVAVELRDLGITDKNTVLAVAARVHVQDSGRLVGLDAEGVQGVGSGPDYHMTVSDVVRDMGLTAAPAPTAPRVVVDPAKAGFNLTAALAAARNDPELYDELMERLAPRPVMPSVRFT